MGNLIEWRRFALVIWCALVSILSPSYAGNFTENQGGRVVSTADIAQLKDIDTFSIAPNGELITVLVRQAAPTKNAYKNEWIVLSREERKRYSIGDTRDVIPSSTDDGFPTGMITPPSPAKWSPDSDKFAFLAWKNDELQIWIADTKEKSLRQATSNPADVRDFEWSLDGDEIFFQIESVTRLEKNTRLRQEAETGFLIDSRFSPAASVTPIIGRSTGPGVWAIDIETRKSKKTRFDDLKSVTSVNSPKPKSSSDCARHIVRPHSGNNIAWTEQVDPSHLASTPVRKIVAELDDDQQQLVECASEFCVGNMLFVSWNTEGDEVFFGRREGPNLADTSVYSWSPYSGEVRIVRGIDDEWTEECQPSEDSLVCIRQTPTEPAHLISIDYKTGDVVTIFDPNPEFKDLIKGDVKRIAWSNGWTDWGDDVIGHLVYPLNYDTERSYPLVVVQYRSRGFLRGGVGDEYPILPLSAAGFAVLSIDRPNPWKLFETLTGRDLGAALFASAKDNDWDRALENVMNGIEAIDSEIRIDKERMAIVGLSDGTVSTLNALMNTDFFTIGIISSNSWDPIGYYLAGVNWKTTLKTIGFEDPATGSLEHWQRISPALNAEKIDAPLLLNLPQSEFLVSTQFLSALQSFERPHEAYVYPDEYHIKWQPIHRYVIYRRNVQWLQFWLLDHEAVDPVDRKQYVRWRKIREDACVNGEGNEQDRPGFCQ